MKVNLFVYSKKKFHFYLCYDNRYVRGTLLPPTQLSRELWNGHISRNWLVDYIINDLRKKIIIFICTNWLNFYIFTVLGSRKISQLGVTLTHEHLSLDFCTFYVPPPRQLDSLFEKKIQLDNVGFIKQYP